MNSSFDPPWMAHELNDLSERQLRRVRRTVESRGEGRIRIDGRDYVDFSSNDYLGLAGHPEIVEAARQASLEWGWGAGASPLITGYTRAHQELEQAIAEFEGTESAVVFGSGFAANLGTISAAVGKGDLILSERRNHASLIDACRLSRATVRLFDGQRLEQFDSLLKDAASFRRRLIVTDSVFSMDGDVAPLVALADQAERYEAMLYVDEAHATGILGTNGRGACEEAGIEHRVTFRMGTLSKGVGSVGGFVAGSRTMVDWLVNRARPYIYSTNLPPTAAAASRAGVQFLIREPSRRRELLASATKIREALAANGWNVGSSRTQIIPVILGDERAALALSTLLQERGIYSPAIRPPTVSQGTSRLRLSLSFHHKSNDLNHLLLSLPEEKGG